MANTIVTLTHSSINSGNAIQVYCTSVKATLNKKNNKTPNANYSQYPADVQTLGRENARYTLAGCKVDVGDLSYSILLDLVNLEHDSANPLILNVKYNAKYLTDSLSSTTDIPVTIDGPLSVDFSAIDSKNSYMPSLNIPLVEVDSD